MCELQGSWKRYKGILYILYRYKQVQSYIIIQQILVKQATRTNAVLDAHFKIMPIHMIIHLFNFLLFNCEIWRIKISKELERFH